MLVSRRQQPPLARRGLRTVQTARPSGAGAGGKKAARGTKGVGVTKPGVLHALMSFPLKDLTPQAVEAWAATEAVARATQARLGARMLNAFVTWCEDHPDYKGLVPSGTATVKARRTREALGKAKVKSDSLMREQLVNWFSAVRTLGNPEASACLQVLLLTGARWTCCACTTRRSKRGCLNKAVCNSSTKTIRVG